MEHKQINYITILSLLVIGCGLNKAQKVNDFKSQLKFSSVYAKNKEGKPVWSIVNKMNTTKFNYNQKLGQIIVDYGDDTDSFHIQPVDVNNINGFSKSYGAFQFVNVFQNDLVPKDFYFLFYVNPRNNDVLEVIRSGGGKNVGNNCTVFLFTHDSVNYLKDLKFF